MIFSFDDEFGTHKDLITEAALFFIDTLIPKENSENLYISFEIDPDIEYDGMCVNDDELDDELGGFDHEEIDLNRCYTITFRRFNPKKMNEVIRILAHEMVHVKQYVMDELTGVTYARWMGKDYIDEDNPYSYYDSPWEIEAYGREIGLIKRWNDYIEKKK